MEVLTMTIECSNGALFPPMVMKMVVPEKAESIAAILADRGITFRMDEDSETIEFRSFSKENVIVVGTKCLARLWVHAFASFTIFHDTVQSKTIAPKATLDLRSSVRLHAAATLLKWAIKADLQVVLSNQIAIQPELLSLPNELKAVFFGEDFERDKHLADDHAFVALGFILYHELAHIVLGHTAQRGMLSIEQEKDADKLAVEWLLDSPGLSTKETLARQFGIAIALGWFASLSIYVGHRDGSTHPPAWDRLYQVFEQYVEDDGAIIWAFIAVMLGVHLENQRRSHIDLEREFDSFKASVNYYIDVMSRLEN